MNNSIYKLFESNRRILYYLLQRNIMSIDESIINQLNIQNQWRNFLYFSPQIRPFFNEQQRREIEGELLQINDNISTHFDELCLMGENDSYISDLIRRDSVEEFITFCTQTNTSVNSYINHSIFETNSYLINKTPSLIEYAAFFGSIQIFQYLKLSGAELNPSLWMYVIHGKNSELVHILEENNIIPENGNYIDCYKEAVKCHHNDIANYIFNSFLNPENEILSFGFRFFNIHFLPDDFNNVDQRIYFYFCQYDYYTFTEAFIRTPGFDINKKIILNKKSIFMMFIFFFLKYFEWHFNFFFNYISVFIFNKSALTVAAENDKYDIIELLLSQPSIDFHEECFAGTMLNKLRIPPSVTSLPTGAFRACSSLREVIIPDSVISFGCDVFSACESLTQITIPPSVTTIGAHAFGGCCSLTQITIPPSINRIESSTFSGCSSLTPITIPPSVTAIDDNVFNDCSSLNQINIPTSVTVISNFSFCGCSSLTLINIPPHVITIGNCAFQRCSVLSQLTLPQSITSIGNSAFEECSSLLRIEISQLITEIKHSAFLNCSSLREVIIPSSINIIHPCAFQGCSSLTCINIPSSVVSIMKCAFKGCSQLAQLTLPSSVESIGDSAFEECSSLVRVEIPTSTTIIKQYTFSNCSSLREVLIPPSITSIEQYAFQS